MAKKILLQHGCSMSTPSVFPKNWKTGGKTLLNLEWRVQYYFYDPEFHEKYPYGKLMIVKGMNSYKDVIQRRQATSLLIENEIRNNQNGYNPISKTFINAEEDSFDYEIHPNTKFIDALILSKERLSVGEYTHKDIKGTINQIKKAAKQLRLIDKPISEIRIRHLRSCLEQIEKK